MANKKPSTGTIKILKNVSQNYNVEMKDIKMMFTKLLASRAVQNLDVVNEPEREKHAVRILVAEFTAERDRKEFSGKVTPVVMRIESKEAISEFKKAGTNEPGYRSGLYVTMQDEDENVAVAKLTLWNDACETHPNLVVGETYSTQVVIGNRGAIWECSMNEATDLEDSDVHLKPIAELIGENFTPISITEIENNISKDRNDSKLIEGIVISSWQKVTANNRDMGFLKLMGDITDFDESIVAKFSGNANCVNNVGAGDLVYVLGQTTAATVSNDGSQEYPIGMWGELIIPVLAIERTEDDSNESEENDVGDESEENDDISGSIDNW